MSLKIVSDLVMPGKYKRKTQRQSWEEIQMQRAIDAVNSKEMGWLKASKTFGVPQATLRRRAVGKYLRVTGTKKGLGRYAVTFPTELEEELVIYI